MKIATFGARHWGSQQPRIDEGLVALGHELTPHSHEADLIYSNDPAAFDQILLDRCGSKLRGRVIFNVLDLPLHIPNFDYAKLKAQLVQADAVTSISEYVQWQCREYLGIETHVIYNPMKPVTRDPSAAQITPKAPFLHVGRRFDPNKRAALGVYALQLLGYGPQDIFLVGNETGWGDYIGVLDDWGLNSAYNTVNFVLCTSKVEGLCLPVVEAMAAGAIPVVCNDMTTRRELLPPDLFPEYNAVDPTPESVARFISRHANDSAAMAALKERLHTHYQTNWAHKLTGRAVAEQILEAAKNIS